MQWSDAYRIGVPVIDTDHQLLFALTAQLAEAREEGQTREVVGSVMNVLVEYIVHHFRREERLLQLVEYPELNEHKKGHRQLTGDVFALLDRWQDGKHGAADELVSLMDGWLAGHILGVDTRYKPWVEKTLSDKTGAKATESNWAILEMDFQDWDTGVDDQRGLGN